jgi:hypothetical protein
MRWKWVFIVPAALLGIVLVTFIGGQAVRLLWNWLLPPLFGWREVTFWQALGLLVLCRILFGGSGFHRPGRSNSGIRRRMADRMADRVADRWEHMSPEERERFRQRLRERCGFDPAGSETKGTDSRSTPV